MTWCSRQAAQSNSKNERTDVQSHFGFTVVNSTSATGHMRVTSERYESARNGSHPCKPASHDPGPDAALPPYIDGTHRLGVRERRRLRGSSDSACTVSWIAPTRAPPLIPSTIPDTNVSKESRLAAELFVPVSAKALVT